MTIKELSQLYYLKEEIKRDKMRLKQIETADIQAAKLTGMPHAARLIYDPMAEKIVSTVDLKKTLKKTLKKAIKRSCYEELKLMRYISSIDDCFIRLIFKLRFIDCKTWWQVAWEVGGNNTAASVKMCCYRHLHSK